MGKVALHCLIARLPNPLVQVEVSLWFRDRLLLGGLQRFLEPARERIAARLFGLHGLVEQRVTARFFVRENPMRVVELGFVGAFDFDVSDDAPQSVVDDERRLAAGTSDFVFGSECSHRDPPSCAAHARRAKPGTMIRTCRATGWTSESSPTTSIGRAGWIGGPGRSASPRCLRAVGADIIALQEVVGPGLGGPGHAEEIGAALGMGWVMAPTRTLRRHQFGNVVLSRFPIRDHAQLDLSWKTCEPRNSQRVAIEIGPGRPLHVYNVHLGTALLERRYQAPRLAAWVQDRRIHGPKVVLGDFNEWGRGFVSDHLAERLKSVDLYPHLRRRRTYPGFFPLLHLDHIYFDGDIEIRRIELPRSRQALVASDHLPLVADLRCRC